jgi:hypothetical protein
MSDDQLSLLGQVRREQILRLALRQVRRQRRRRLAARAGACCVALVVIGVAVFHTARWQLNRPVAPVAVTSVPGVSPQTDRPNAGRIVVQHIQTDPNIVRRLAVTPRAPKWVRIDDDQLLQELATAGKPAGLAKINGQVTLIYHARR